MSDLENQKITIESLLKEVEEKKSKWYHEPDTFVLLSPYYSGSEYILWIKKCCEYLKKYYVDDDNAKRFIELGQENPRECDNSELDEMIACLKMLLEKDRTEETIVINQEHFFSSDILANASTYYIRVLEDINKCYKYGIYDACFILIRKLINQLLLEVLKKNGDIEEAYEGSKMKDLKSIIAIFLNKKYWMYDRKTGNTLDKIRDYGNSSTHNFYFSANKNDLDKEYDNYRFLIQELSMNVF